MKKALVILAFASAGIGAVLSVTTSSDRGLTQNQPSNIPSEILKKMSTEEINRLTMFQKRPLTSASEKEIKQAAVNYTLAHSSQFNKLSGTPEAIFARPIKATEIPSTGLGEINFMGEEPPLMLVVVKGDFDTSSFIPRRFQTSNPPRSTKYIAYVFDLRAGIPALTATGLTGKYFRNALNDSTLPDESKPVDPQQGKPEALPGEKVEPPAQKLPYGTTIPGETPTKNP